MQECQESPPQACLARGAGSAAGVTCWGALAGQPCEQELGCLGDSVPAASAFFGRVSIDVFAKRGKRLSDVRLILEILGKTELHLRLDCRTSQSHWGSRVQRGDCHCQATCCGFPSPCAPLSSGHLLTWSKWDRGAMPAVGC